MKFYTSSELLAELDNFSLEQLLEVKVYVDKLIQSKTLNTAREENIIPHGRTVVITGKSKVGATEVSGLAQDVDIVSSVKQVNNQSDMQALDSMIALVSEWQQDESGYDEEVYPSIEAALNQD